MHLPQRDISWDATHEPLRSRKQSSWTTAARSQGYADGQSEQFRATREILSTTFRRPSWLARMQQAQSWRLFIVSMGIRPEVGYQAFARPIRQQKVIRVEGPRSANRVRAERGEGKQCDFILPGYPWRLPAARQVLLAEKEGANSACGFERPSASQTEDEGTTLQSVVFVFSPVDTGSRRSDG